MSTSRQIRSGALRTLAALAATLLLMAACSPPKEIFVTQAPKPTEAPVSKQPATLTPAPPVTILPAPTKAPVPAPSATTGPEVNRLADIVLGHIRHLSVTLGLRTSATPKEKAAADYIQEVLARLGYKTSFNPFAVRHFSTRNPSLTLEKPSSQVIKANPMTMSAVSTVSGLLVPAGMGREEDFPKETQGKVALIERGTLQFQVKTANAARAGAVAVAVYNNATGNFFGSLQSQSSIPVVSISQEDGQKLNELVKGGEVQVRVSVEIEEEPSQNVVATRTGDDKIIIVGGHYDTTELGPGANDNASGTAAMLAVAQEMSKRQFKHTIRFIAFGSEEAGLVGSRNYVQSLPPTELKNIIAMINLDGLAGGSNLGIGGDPDLTAKALDIAKRNNFRAVASREPENTASDHFSFVRAGVPSVFIFGSDFRRFHTPEDTVDFVDRELVGQATEIAISLVEALDAQ